jgi:hypothetical protein
MAIAEKDNCPIIESWALSYTSIKTEAELKVAWFGMKNLGEPNPGCSMNYFKCKSIQVKRVKKDGVYSHFRLKRETISLFLINDIR